MQMTKAIIYIEEGNSMADVTFPSVPVVKSLLQYDDTISVPESRPEAGYPVICVTVCIEFYIPSSVLHCELDSISAQNVYRYLVICVAESQPHYFNYSSVAHHTVWLSILSLSL